ncbi:MAG: hypothetical protein IPK22_15540 [Verrucomicrobiaceae bacterium]|nr:hypothetical protein [Verrucomicrobiaceae bacterium]
MRALAVLFTFCLSAAAQPGDTPPPPKNGERRGPPGMSGGIRPPGGFEKLTEEERKLMRDAFEKAWKDPKVIEARDQALRANENVRRVLHEAMSKGDAKVTALLEKMKPPFETDDRGFPILPSPDSPNFVNVAVARLSAEMMSVAKPGKQEDSHRLHERIVQHPRMKDALATLIQTPSGERLEYLRKVRDLYKQLVGEEFARFRKAREEGGPPPPKPETK